MSDNTTRYSVQIDGDKGNYGWAVRFDLSRGYLGINQYIFESDSDSRVLLSPKQVDGLLKFVEEIKTTKKRKMACPDCGGTGLSKSGEEGCKTCGGRGRVYYTLSK